MYIVVVGGGRVGYFLTRALLNEGHEVLVIEKDSNAIGNSLTNLRVASETGVRIVALRRAKRWIYSPKHISLKESDIAIGVGPEEGLEQLSRFFKGKEEVLE